MYKLQRLNRLVLMIMLTAFCSVTMSGCASFRKKFVRQNKNRTVKEEFIPVLEPVEYKRKQSLPIDVYKSHYSMLKVYFNDMFASLGSSNAGEKRERYLLNQMIAHLQGMEILLNDERRPQVQRSAADLQETIKELDKPSGMRRYDLLESLLRKIEKEIRKTLKPDMVKEFLKAQ